MKFSCMRKKKQGYAEHRAMETGSESKDFTEQSIVFNLHLKLQQLKGTGGCRRVQANEPFGSVQFSCTC
jgi:hypothetical protein